MSQMKQELKSRALEDFVGDFGLLIIKVTLIGKVGVSAVSTCGAVTVEAHC